MMKFTRRDFVHAGCTIGAVALASSPIDKAQAMLHRGGGSVFPPVAGKNQKGIQGINYYLGTNPFTNWINNGSFNGMTLTQAISAGGGTITQTGGLATITTPAPHGLAIGVIPQAGWNLTVAGATQTGYNLSGSIFTVTGANTITYPVNAGTVSPATTSSSITFTVNLNIVSPGSPNSVVPAINQNQFLTTDGFPQANLSNVTSINIGWIFYALNEGYLMAGVTRNGQRFECHWQGNVAGTAGFQSGSGNIPTVTSLGTQANTWTWQSSMDTQNEIWGFTIPNPADPPTQCFMGLSDGTRNPATDNYQLWLNGQYWDPVYINMQAGMCGMIRVMDLINTNSNYTSIYTFSDLLPITAVSWNTAGKGLPLDAVIQLANLTNKHLYLNVPSNLGQKRGYQAISPTLASVSAPGSNCIITYPSAHPFSTNDLIVPLLFGGLGTFGAGFGLQSGGSFSGSISGTALTQISTYTNGGSQRPLVVGMGITGAGIPANTVITGGSFPNWTINNSATTGTISISPVEVSANPAGIGSGSFMTWIGANLVNGQIVTPSGSGVGLLGLTSGRNYYAANVGVNGAWTFQLATTLANALAGTPIVTLNAGTYTQALASQINRNAFSVGTTTSLTTELAHTDTSSWGQQEFCTITVGTPATITNPLKAVSNNQIFYLNYSSGGALPTGLSAGTPYYALSAAAAGVAFQFSTSPGGAAVSATGSTTGSAYCVTGIAAATGGGGASSPGVCCPYQNPTTEVTTYLTYLKNKLNPGIVMTLDLGNEMWNTNFNGFARNAAWAHSFVDANGIQAFPGDNNNGMQGYALASVHKIARDIWGGGASGPHSTLWRGTMGLQNLGYSTPSSISGIMVGYQYYLTNVAVGLTVNDLLTSYSMTDYYGLTNRNSRGNVGGYPASGAIAYAGITISATSPAVVTLGGTNTLTQASFTGTQSSSGGINYITISNVSGKTSAPVLTGDTIFGTGIAAGTKLIAQITGTSGGAGLYQTDLAGTASNAACTSGPIGVPLIFTPDNSVGGVLPNDLATGQPLGQGCFSPGIFGYPSSSGLSGYFTAGSPGTFTVTAVPGNTDSCTISIGANATITDGTRTYATGQVFYLNGSLPGGVAAGQRYFATSAGNTFTFSTVAGGQNITTSGSAGACTIINRPPLTAGMTIWGNMTKVTGVTVINGALAFSGVYPAVITSQVSGTPGGVGVYNMSFSQTVGSAGSPLTGLQAMNINENSTVYYPTSLGQNFTFSATPGGPNVNCDPANPGVSGALQRVDSSYTSMWQSWMTQSVALNLSNPATYPSRYSYFNSILNSTIQASYTTGYQPGYYTTAVQAVLTNAFGGTNQPFPLEVQAYEGGWSNELALTNLNYPTGGSIPMNIVGMNNSATNSPMYQEFWPQSIGTIEDAATATANVNNFYATKTYAISVGATNASAISMTYPSKYGDSLTPAYTFAFALNSFCDHANGFGFPTWQNVSINSHPTYDAYVALN